MGTLPGAIRVRAEESGDHSAVYEINLRAFGQPGEAKLVEALRRNLDTCISLVAERDGQVVGHILFSPVSIEGAGDGIRAMGLAPMAVAPECQRQGIGSELVRVGLKACRDGGYGAVVLVGHPEFYPRFGFVPASTYSLRCEYEVPDPVFMATELTPGALGRAGGLVKYAPEFANL